MCIIVEHSKKKKRYLLHLLITIVIRMILSVVITSNKAQRHCEGTNVEQRDACHK